MSQLRAILVGETEKARKFRVADREVWIPRSVVKTITKLMPAADGTRECVLDVEDWFTEKEGL